MGSLGEQSLLHAQTHPRQFQWLYYIWGRICQNFLKHRICKMNETMKCFIDTRRQEVKDETRGKLRKLNLVGGTHYSQAPSI